MYVCLAFGSFIEKRCPVFLRVCGVVCRGDMNGVGWRRMKEIMKILNKLSFLANWFFISLTFDLDHGRFDIKARGESCFHAGPLGNDVHR